MAVAVVVVSVGKWVLGSSQISVAELIGRETRKELLFLPGLSLPGLMLVGAVLQKEKWEAWMLWAAGSAVAVPFFFFVFALAIDEFFWPMFVPFSLLFELTLCSAVLASLVILDAGGWEMGPASGGKLREPAGITAKPRNGGL